MHGRLDRVGDGVALPDRRVRLDPDDGVHEVLAAGLAGTQAPQVHTRLGVPDRLARPRGCRRRRTIHEDVDVLAHQTHGGQDHEHRDDQRRDRVGPRVPRPREEERDEHGCRADQIGAEVQRVRGERGRPVAL